MDKLTFKQYLETKHQLVEALDKTPKHKIKYKINKYCKIVVGESKDHKEYINLKPKNHIIVEWLYEDENNPSIHSILLPDVSGISPEDEFETFWPKERFSKWLSKNTNELKNQ
jgi:hypothetical protein